MATGNFINHENGIFAVLETTIEDYMEDFIDSNYDNYRDYYFENDEEDDDYMAYYDQFVKDVKNGIYNDSMWDILSFYFEEEVEYTWETIKTAIENYGYSVWERNCDTLVITNTKNYDERYVATISRESGYYSGIQFIVDTDYLDQDYVETFDYEEDKDLPADEVFDSEGAEKVIEIVGMYTTKLEVFASFSNGETMYSLS